jgi:glycosyltransferase involved in cell wall biosynthesis
LNPLVTAVMVTGKHFEARFPFIQESVRAYSEQTYENRKLLIINTGPRAVAEGVATVRELRISEAPLGALRNFALDDIRREDPESLVAQWDDDDFSHPDRLASQVSAYLDQTDGFPVTLGRQIRYSFVTDSAFDPSDPQKLGHFGTVLHPPTDLRYEEVGRHEDSRFLKLFGGVRVLYGPPRLYVRFEHGKNTWNRRHIMRRMEKPQLRGKWTLGPEDADYLRALLKERYAWRR